MDKIYETSADLHVVATKVYVKNGDAYAYSNTATTEKITADSLKNMFLKGTVVVDAAGIMYAPVSFHMESAVGVLTYVKTNGTTPTTADLAVIKSSEYTA